MPKPLVVDLFCGLGGWAEGFLAEGYDVIGFDIEWHDYGTGVYPGQLVLQDVVTLHGSQFKDAACIVASPPCQEYSYMAMPWSRAKQIARALRNQDDFPEGYTGSRTRAELTALFDACFRIQREASEAAGRQIPMVVENVRGAQEWVGRAQWNYGSFYLWGDVPALMPIVRTSKNGGGSWFNVAHKTESGTGRNPVKVPGFRFDGSGRSFQTAAVDGLKTVGHVNQRDGYGHTRHLTSQRESDGVKQGGSGAAWFDGAIPSLSSKSKARKAASAQIAKIPLPLARHIARCFKPHASTVQSLPTVCAAAGP